MQKKNLIIVVVLVLISILGTVLGLTVFNKDWNAANDAYAKEVTIVEKKNEKLDKLISKSEKLTMTKETALDESTVPALETAISEAKAARQSIPEKPLKTSDILSVVKTLKEINYDDIEVNLQSKYDALEKSLKQYALVNHPTEAYVIQCLKKVPTVTGIAAATEDNDPNGHLNKAGGYTAQVYFTSSLVNQNEVYGTSIIDKGTDAGGSIEVYATVEDANERENYLATLDGGIFASGSHKVIGTVLVRTSDKLTATQQKEMEANIIAALIDLGDDEKAAEEVTVENPVATTSSNTANKTKLTTKKVTVAQTTVSTCKQEALLTLKELMDDGNASRKESPRMLKDLGYSQEEVDYAISQISWSEAALKCLNKTVEYEVLEQLEVFPLELRKSLTDFQFTSSEINYAMNNCYMSWNELAAHTAKCMYWFMPDLTSIQAKDKLVAGGYTEPQATYGINNCGIDWLEK